MTPKLSIFLLLLMMFFSSLINYVFLLRAEATVDPPRATITKHLGGRGSYVAYFSKADVEEEFNTDFGECIVWVTSKRLDIDTSLRYQDFDNFTVYVPEGDTRIDVEFSVEGYVESYQNTNPEYDSPTAKHFAKNLNGIMLRTLRTSYIVNPDGMGPIAAGFKLDNISTIYGIR